MHWCNTSLVIWYESKKEAEFQVVADLGVVHVKQINPPVGPQASKTVNKLESPRWRCNEAEVSLGSLAIKGSAI